MRIYNNCLPPSVLGALFNIHALERALINYHISLLITSYEKEKSTIPALLLLFRLSLAIIKIKSNVNKYYA